MRLQDSPGRAVAVSPGLAEAVGVALALAEATGGLLDPTVGGRAAMPRIRPGTSCLSLTGSPVGAPVTSGGPGMALRHLGYLGGTVELPSGVELDLGASAKALAVDRAVARIGRSFGCGVLVSIGGDIAVAGEMPASGFCAPVADVCTDSGR